MQLELAVIRHQVDAHLVPQREEDGYSHKYADGRIVDANLYPNELLAAFRKHFHEVWLPHRAFAYFTEKDPVALPFLQKLLPAPVAVKKISAARAV